jgi:hypothetical protein
MTKGGEIMGKEEGDKKIATAIKVQRKEEEKKKEEPKDEDKGEGGEK